MKKQSIKKRITAAILFAAAALAVLSGCANSNGDATPTGTPEAGKPVPGIYTAEKLALTDGEMVIGEVINGESGDEVGYSERISFANGRLFYDFTKWYSARGDDGSYTSESEISILSSNTDGTDPVVVWGPVSSSYDTNQARNEQIYLSGFEIDAEGNIWILEQLSIDDNTDPLDPIYENRTIVKKIAPDGTELITIDVESIPDYDAQGYMQGMAIDGDGDVYLCFGGNADSKIAVLSGETGAYMFTVREQDYLNSMTTLGTGEVGYYVYRRANGGRILKAVDKSTRTITEKPFVGRTDVNDIYSGYGDYDFLYFASNTLFGYNATTQSSEPVVLFFDSGIAADRLRSVIPMDNDEFIVYTDSYTGSRGGDDDSGIFLIKPNLDPAFGLKRVITLGGLYLDSNARAAAMAFNKTSADARITFRDYGEYNTPDDYNRGATQLDLDILGGNAPDIISLSSLPANKYDSKGIFTDLYPLLDADPALERSDLYENILKIGEFNGKLTNIITDFNLTTAAGKKSIFGDRTGITTDELEAIADAHPNAQIFRNMTVNDWMSYITMLTLDDFVDWGAGVCSFNSPEFIGMLRLAKRFRKEDIDYMNFDWMAEETEAAEALKNGDTLLTLMNIYNPRAMRDAYGLFGDDAVFVGFPTAGASGSVVTPGGRFAIAESSPHKQEAWSFISYLLQKNEYASGFSDAWLLYTNKGPFMKKAEEEMIPLRDRDFTNGITITETHGNGSSAWMVNSIEELMTNNMFTQEQIDNYHLTQAEVDAVLAVISGAERASSFNTQKISEIISEEIGVFAAGSKSAEETAAVIQSRVQILVSEGM
ncbi:MAG: extracellular solute-binding protein [Oscillospiraceae bacterium]|jgi:ABC-type glycerol-3-phosphate transport system substrate-binding protein|nr:extracellular solute-binding protein [Oscillospiraceae bacterium]